MFTYTYISYSHLNESISFDDMIRYIFRSSIKSKRKSKQRTHFEIQADLFFIKKIFLFRFETMAATMVSMFIIIIKIKGKFKSYSFFELNNFGFCFRFVLFWFLFLIENLQVLDGNVNAKWKMEKTKKKKNPFTNEIILP